MQNALQTNMSKTSRNKPYLVHYLRSSVILDNVPLQKATKLCPDVPVLVVSFTENSVKARCCVPKVLFDCISVKLIDKINKILGLSK